MTTMLSHDLKPNKVMARSKSKSKVKGQSQGPASAHKSNLKNDSEVNATSKFEATSKWMLSTRLEDSQVEVRVKTNKSQSSIG